MTNIIKARRKLGELFREGVEVRFGPGPNGAPVGRIAPGGKGYFMIPESDPPEREPLGDDEIAMWVQAPSPLQREQALRDAQGARAKALLRVKRNEESEEHLTVMAFIAEMEDETLYDYVLLGQKEERKHQAMREVLAEPEWEDITQYQDAMASFGDQPPIQGTPEWDDYQALLDLDTKFGEQVDKLEREMRSTAYDALKMKGRKEAEKEAVKRRSEIAGSQAFMFEYEQKMLWYSVRDIDQIQELFFEKATDLAGMHDHIQETIGEAMDPFINDAAEAKNWQRVASGSTSSEPPSKPETSEASIPQELTE